MSKLSKTARASTVGKRASSGFVRSPDAPIITPLAGGEYAYVFTDEGVTLHLKTDSDAFFASLGNLDSERVTARLAELHENHPKHGWDNVLEVFVATTRTTEVR